MYVTVSVHRFSGADDIAHLASVGARIHPKAGADRSGYTAQEFESGDGPVATRD